MSRWQQYTIIFLPCLANILNELTAFIVNIVLFPTTFYFLVAETVGPSQPSEEGEQSDITNNDIIKEKPHPDQASSNTNINSEYLPTYTWIKAGHTACSTTCGTGEEIKYHSKKGCLYVLLIPPKSLFFRIVCLLNSNFEFSVPHALNGVETIIHTVYLRPQVYSRIVEYIYCSNGIQERTILKIDRHKVD